MKTHELAKALEVLAKMLRSQPNQELSSLASDVGRGPSWMSPDQIKISLSHLAALSRIDKQQWISLIEDFRFPIDIRPRDASRDILGKLLRYLEEHEDARRRLAHGSHTRSSPELLHALNTLLKNSE